MESEPVITHSPEQNPDARSILSGPSSPMDLFAFSGDGYENHIVHTKFNLFRIFAKLFRYLEVCVVLIFLSWIFSQLPLAVRIAGDYARKLLHFLLTPLFGFILCNAIVATLLARPCRFSGHCFSAVDSETELYEEFFENQRELVAEKEPPCSEPDEVVFQDKQIVSDEKSHAAEMDSDTCSESDSGMKTLNTCERSQSGKMSKREPSENSSKKLGSRRHSIDRNPVCPRRSSHYQDDLSGDEFKEKIEAFIAKELRFRREESPEIVINTIISSH